MRPLFLNGIPKAKRPLFVPDFTADSILDVDFKALKKLGVTHILVDLDLTLRRKMTRSLEPAISKYLMKSLKEQGFTTISIASNNMLNLRGYSAPISARIFQPFWNGARLIRKPNLKFYERILRELNVKPNTCVMIGDKLRGDVYGGNRAGMFTVLVKPKGNDYWYDRVLFTRIREGRALGRYLPKKTEK